jgi:hypothetical protein
MPVIGIIPRGQSEAGFFVDGTFVYREAALTAIGSPRSGTGRLLAELSRLTTGAPGGTWTANFYGNTYADGTTVNPVRWGGTAFVPQWILPGGDATPLASNADARLDVTRGQPYFNSLDALLTANAASVDAWAIIWFRQTFEANTSQWVSIAEYVLGVTLWINYEAAKIAAAMGSKPWRIIVAHPGVTQGGDRRHALLREIQSHLAVNGRRSTRAELASFPVIPGFYVGDHTSDHVTVTTQDIADDGTQDAANDFLHQTVGSSLHSGARLAQYFTKWLSPSAALPFDGFPTIDRVVRVTGDARRVRAVVKITAGNEFRWRGADPEDTGINATGGTAANPGHGTLWLHSTPINDANLPAAVAVSSVTVTPGAPSGYAWLDLVTTSDVPGSTVLLTVYPDRQTTSFRRNGESIPTSQKIKLGAFEAVPGSPEWTAAVPHLTVSPPITFMPLAGATNLLVGAAESFTGEGTPSVTAFSDDGLNLLARARYASSKPTRPTAWHIAVGTGFTKAGGLSGQIGARVSTGAWSVAGRVASSPAATSFADTTGATHWAVFTAGTGGTVLFGGALTGAGVALPAGAFTVTLNGGGDQAANDSLTWLLTAAAVTLPSAWHVAVGTGASASAISGQAGSRQAATPSVTGGVATFGSGYTVSIGADAGSVSAVGVFTAGTGGTLLDYLTQAGVATGAAGNISVATGGTVTAT